MRRRALYGTDLKVSTSFVHERLSSCMCCVYVRNVQSALVRGVMLKSMGVGVWMGVQFVTFHSTVARVLSGAVHVPCVSRVRAGVR